MKVIFTQPWHTYKRGEQIDVRWDVAMYLYHCRLVRWIDRPEKISPAELMAENAMAPQGFAENADGRPTFIPTAAGGYQANGPPGPAGMPKGGTGQSRRRMRAKK